MVVHMGTTSKRINSTAIPTGLSEYNAVLKTPSSVESPVLEMSFFNPLYNYAYIPSFHRYYFVTGVTPLSDYLYQYTLVVDTLASFKSAINISKVYVERSESDGNPWLKDETWTHIEGNPTVLSTSTPVSGMSTSGIFILQTVGSGANSIAGGNAMYAISASTLNSLVSELFNTDFYGDGVVDDTTKFYFNPFQYITSCRWFPISINGSATPIKFGWWESKYSGTSITNSGTTLSATVIMPAALDWTSYDPQWSRFTLYLPGIGDIEIDPIFCGKDLNIAFYVDLITGNCNVKVRCEEADIASATGQWGIEVQLTQLSSDPSNMTSTVFQSLDVASGGVFSTSMNLEGVNEMSYSDRVKVGVAGTIVNGARTLMGMFGKGDSIVEAAKNTMSPQLSLSGANGNRSYLSTNQSIILSWKHYDRYYDTTPMFGMPCRRVKTLGDLSGYTICKNASLSISGATSTEVAAIKTALEGGVYLE